MPWWAWMVLGAMLLSAELVAVDLEFYLVFLGLSALVVGGLGLAGLEQPVWLQWVEFAALALLGTFGFRARLYAKLRPSTPELEDGLVGALATLQEAIPAGATGRVQLRGSTWRARNVGDADMAAGASARVLRVEGTVLELWSG